MTKRVGGGLEREHAYADGEIIVREGEPGTEMFIVRSGAVVVSRASGTGEVTLARLERGEFFGEMSVLESMPRDATVRAEGPTTLLVLGAGGLLMRLRQDPSFAVEMLHTLSGRIRALNERLSS